MNNKVDPVKEKIIANIISKVKFWGLAIIEIRFLVCIFFVPLLLPAL